MFIADDGRCARCHKPLEPAWHADHRQAFAAGGQTDPINGQALCPSCNLKKGASRG